MSACCHAAAHTILLALTRRDRGQSCEGERSPEAGVSFAVSGAGVGFGVGLLDASTCAEMSLGFAHSGSSKKERVGAYYNYIYILDIERKRLRKTRSGGTYLRAISR